MKQLIYLTLLVCFFGCKQNANSSSSPKPIPPATTQKAPPVQISIYEYLIKQPKVSVNNPPVLFLLHGYGSNEKDLFKFSQILDDQLMVICPRAPKMMAANRYSWFDLQRTSAGMTHNENEILPASNKLMQFINQMQKKYQFNSDNVFIGGFSQGAIMTLGTGLLNPDKIAGVVCLSGQLYPEFVSAIEDKKKVKQLKVFLSHGRKDNVLPFDRIEKDVQTLEKIGVSVDKHYYDVKHTISQENLQDLIKWMKVNL